MRLAVVAVAMAATSVLHTPGSVAGTTVRLVVQGDDQRPFAFAPLTVTVKPGTIVRWVNDTDAFHTVTFADSPDVRVPNHTFDAALSSRGESLERRFDISGTYSYYCQPHSEFMAGTIDVRAGGGDGSPTWVGWIVAAGVAALIAGFVVRRARRGRSPDAQR
ncbi:MAG TPA: plastocyanin/azurin family copper-binding protein [Acidimicrobiales bacterium]|jgi:plastocyanin|nr:plastocyanin/azurin family copper-binding protein [Acidimicrobiales bacterium]